MLFSSVVVPSSNRSPQPPVSVQRIARTAYEATNQINRMASKSKKLALGEEAYKDRTRIIVPYPSDKRPRKGVPVFEPQEIWVQIISGNKEKGSGIILDKPRNKAVRLGRAVSFVREPGQELPVMRSLLKRANAEPLLRRAVAEDIKSAILGNLFRK